MLQSGTVLGVRAPGAGSRYPARLCYDHSEMLRIPDVILNAGNRLFWDVDPSGLDPEVHQDFVYGRVLSDGTLEMVRALRAVVGDDGLRDFLARAPHRLDSRSRRFLEVVLKAAPPPPSEEDPCTKTPFQRNNAGLFSP